MIIFELKFENVVLSVGRLDEESIEFDFRKVHTKNGIDYEVTLLRSHTFDDDSAIVLYKVGVRNEEDSSYFLIRTSDFDNDCSYNNIVMYPLACEDEYAAEKYFEVGVKQMIE